jgi:predicted transcriptional regulator
MPDAKTTVYLEAEDYRRVKALARTQGRPAAQLIREAVAEYAQRYARDVVPSSIGAGRSGRGDVADTAEDLLRAMGRDE